MARSQQTWNKIEKEKKKAKKKKEKAAKKLDRAGTSADGNSLEDMIAYVDEFGRITDTPPIRPIRRLSKLRILKLGQERKKTWSLLTKTEQVSLHFSTTQKVLDL